MIARTLASALLVVPLFALACADRDTIGLDDDETGGPLPGEAFSDCIDKGDCDDDWCLHPANETGFCTYACTSTGIDSCDPIPGGTAIPTCLPVDTDEVCALDCGGNKSCPSDMRCEQIQANGEARSICF